MLSLPLKRVITGFMAGDVTDDAAALCSIVASGNSKVGYVLC